MAKRYPGMTPAAQARLSIEIPELAKFYPAPDGRQLNLHPAVAQTGELPL